MRSTSRLNKISEEQGPFLAFLPCRASATHKSCANPSLCLQKENQRNLAQSWCSFLRNMGGRRNLLLQWEAVEFWELLKTARRKDKNAWSHNPYSKGSRETRFGKGHSGEGCTICSSCKQEKLGSRSQMQLLFIQTLGQDSSQAWALASQWFTT